MIGSLAVSREWEEERVQHWRSLLYFSTYRVVSAGVLLGFGIWHLWQNDYSAGNGEAYLVLAVAYTLLSLGFLILVRRERALFHVQLSVQVMVDVSLVTVLGFLAGGLRSGVPLLVLVSLAGAAIIARGRLVLFYAAFAALVLLFAESLSVINGDAPSAEFFQAGVICIAYFATALATHRLSRMALVSEELVRQQAIDLADLAEINQAVLTDMQDAVVVLDAHSRIRHLNPRAIQLLGAAPHDPLGAPLSRYSVDLSDRLRSWEANTTESRIPTLRAPGNNRELRPRFRSIGGDLRQGVSIFLEDVTEAQEIARQGKLAALGRLTANIAHEIRNPLAAISHAAELLAEDYPRDPVEQKLIRIISDNTVRLNRLVNEVLQLNRRDRAQAETIDAGTWLTEWRDAFCEAEQVPLDRISLELAAGLQLRFDRNHLHQVLWNLVRNALRFCQQRRGSVRVVLEQAPGTQGLQLDILDDGPGVPSEQQGQLFEPFFTTDSQGTGLGLYIARELCVANSATLEYVEFAPGAQFRILLPEA